MPDGHTTPLRSVMRCCVSGVSHTKMEVGVGATVRAHGQPLCSRRKCNETVENPLAIGVSDRCPHSSHTNYSRYPRSKSAVPGTPIGFGLAGAVAVFRTACGCDDCVCGCRYPFKRSAVPGTPIGPELFTITGFCWFGCFCGTSDCGFPGVGCGCRRMLPITGWKPLGTSSGVGVPAAE